MHSIYSSKKPVFSVITPSFQQGNFIEKTIQSVLNQNFEKIEYFVCDGGSTDSTVSILQKYQHRLTWVSEPDQGQAHAVNKGLARAQGDIIAWINSDDIYYPQAFAHVSSFLEANPNIGVVYGQADWIDELDRVIAPYPTGPWSYKQLTRECYLCQPAVFFRRSLVERFGDLNINLQYCMDYELWLRYGQTSEFAYLPFKLAGSRIYSTNKTFGNRLAAHCEANYMLREKLGYSTRHWIFEYSKLQLENESSIATSGLMFMFKFLMMAIKNCWLFNQKALLIVSLKIVFYQLLERNGRLRSQQFNVENAVFEPRDQI